jgi:potassium-transporting ATPase potassium-binding subunit
VQNFFRRPPASRSPIALIRGFARHSAHGIGNFWVDLTRSTLYVLLPLSLLSRCASWPGGHPEFRFLPRRAYGRAADLSDNPQLDAAGQPLKDAAGNPSPSATTQTQTLPMGPVASQEAIKMLGTNGGGFFNANSAHPYENPTPLTNFVQMLAIFLIPAALCFVFGAWSATRARAGRSWRDGRRCSSSLRCWLWAEQHGNPLFTRWASIRRERAPGRRQHGGQGDALRHRRLGAVRAVTTAASCGAVNTMHDSFTPLGGFVPMWLMQLGEVVFGGVGTGLYGMLIFAIIGGLHRRADDRPHARVLGKKIEAFEMKMASIVILVTPFMVLVGTAVAVMSERARPASPTRARTASARSSTRSPRRQQQRQRLRRPVGQHAVLQRAARLAMWFGRFWPIVPVLAIAGSLAERSACRSPPARMPTHGPLFVAC